MSQIRIRNVVPVTIQATRGYGEWVMVKVQTDQGIEGIGEGFTWRGEANAVRNHIVSIGQELVGGDPLAIESFVDRFLPIADGREACAAVSALEIALWDILGQVAELPVCALLGGQRRQAIPLYADHGVFDGADDWGERVERIVAAKEAGFEMFKWDPFEGRGTPDPRELASQIARVEQVRNAVGDGYRLAIDAHNRFSLEGALMAAEALEPLDILFFEAPTEDDPDLLRRIADATSIPLATGELTCSRAEAKAVLDSGALAYFQPETGTNGGILESCKTASLAQVYGVDIAIHNWCGPVVTRAASHVCATVPNLLYQEYAGGAPKNEWENDLLYPPSRVENGHLILPEGPGLGFRLNEDLVVARSVD
tara:strand:+ start:765 stop:1868 length:1104 start_codon:yes stop_codon:yes gene_type:complete